MSNDSGRFGKLILGSHILISKDLLKLISWVDVRRVHVLSMILIVDNETFREVQLGSR